MVGTRPRQKMSSRVPGRGRRVAPAGRGPRRRGDEPQAHLVQSVDLTKIVYIGISHSYDVGGSVVGGRCVECVIASQ